MVIKVVTFLSLICIINITLVHTNTVITLLIHHVVIPDSSPSPITSNYSDENNLWQGTLSLGTLQV